MELLPSVYTSDLANTLVWHIDAIAKEKWKRRQRDGELGPMTLANRFPTLGSRQEFS
jgi:hypothetical protein